MPDAKTEPKTDPKPGSKKVAEEKRKEPKQIDIHGRLAYREVDTEEHTTVTETFTAQHFGMRITANALNNVQDMDDPEKRRKKLQKRVKALPDVETIPEGAKKSESELIIAKALATNLKGKF